MALCLTSGKYVSPVQKISNPDSLADFRPISVTSLLSRLTEKLVVGNWLMPAIPDNYINDQFGFRPTGSTTSALVYMTHQSLLTPSQREADS